MPVAEIRVPIAAEIDIITARGQGRDLARSAGFSIGDQTVIAAAVSEIARNILMYAKRGEIRFQVMNDEGVYMFSTYRGKWIPDTPVQRKAVIDRLRTWNAFSNSSPVEGIVEAIRTYYSKDRKISLYVFGDEFTGSSIDSVVKAVDMINREDKTGERRVRIHAVGFPLRPDAPQYTSVRFATLMRILCGRNGGTFVGIDKS